MWPPCASQQATQRHLMDNTRRAILRGLSVTDRLMSSQSHRRIIVPLGHPIPHTTSRLRPTCERSLSCSLCWIEGRSTPGKGEVDSRIKTSPRFPSYRIIRSTAAFITVINILGIKLLHKVSVFSFVMVF